LSEEVSVVKRVLEQLLREFLSSIILKKHGELLLLIRQQVSLQGPEEFAT